MKKALVTGANGFIGSALVRKLLKHNIEVIALDLDGCNRNIPYEARFIPMDLSGSSMLPEIIPDRDIDVFYHFAWASSYGNNRGDPYTQLNNVVWTIDCLNAAEKMRVRKFVGVGSIMEDEAVAAAYDNDNTPGAACVYGSGKLAAHSIAMYLARQMETQVIWARITNTYGVGEISPRFINSTIRKIINNEPLKFTSATQNYDFIYIDDVVRAFVLVGEHGKQFRSYMIGGPEPKCLKEYILEIKRVLAPNREFIFGTVPFTGVNTPMSGFDYSLVERDTGFKAEVSFAEGIKRTMEWLREVIK